MVTSKDFIYRLKIRTRSLNELKVQNVVSENIHATTTEGIGFSGEEERGVHHRDIFLEGSHDA